MQDYLIKFLGDNGGELPLKAERRYIKEVGEPDKALAYVRNKKRKVYINGFLASKGDLEYLSEKMQKGEVRIYGKDSVDGIFITTVEGKF